MSTPRRDSSPAAIERHPHLADPPPDGWVRVDMHSHTIALNRGKREIRVIDGGEVSATVTPQVHTSAKKRAAQRKDYKLPSDFDWDFVS